MHRILAIVVLVGVATSGGRGWSAEHQRASDFQSTIQPLLKNRCVRCHGPAQTKAELNLALATGVARGGKNGPIVVPGKPEESLLWRRVLADEMPGDEPLPADEKELLRSWIVAGAPGLPEHVSAKPDGDEHYAFQPLKPSLLPEVRDPSLVLTPIDRFIQRELESHSLSIDPQADRPTLIRRVAFDLTGLPPTVEEIERFLNNQSDTAYEQMVEFYLASPRYGERWGKYWLDAAGYADSNGYFNADTDRPLAFRYRDYVIRSINADKPWDQFVREQLAGDEIADYVSGSGVAADKVELLEATHFLRNSPDGTDSSDGNADEVRADKYAVLEGTMQIIGASMLGMTVQCAKCHDHKFEPFTQRDFYSLQAVIYPAFNIEKWVKPKDREIIAASTAETSAWEAKVKEADEQIAARRAQFRDWFSQHRERGIVLFQDQFDAPGQKLTSGWANTAPGDESPAGQPAINIDSETAPGAQIDQGRLRIVESRDNGDRAFCTKKAFDWTPDEKEAWIQVTFDLLPQKETASHVGFFLALHDFNDTRDTVGGNVLIDGAHAGGAAVYVDYPGGDSKKRGDIGGGGYEPGRNYGVRVTNQGEGKFELAQIVDGVLEDRVVTLAAEDLPDGGFGFEYCCGRSFAVDNVTIEASDLSPEARSTRNEFAELLSRERASLESDIKQLESKKGDRPGRLAAVTDLSPEPPNVFLLERGQYKSPREKVEAVGPAILASGQETSRSSPPVKLEKHSTGSRLAFAEWLTKPESRAAALLARVTVNRLWQHHFGTGIVATPENLGYSGASPSHPELLEYLASEFVRCGWSTKAIHRILMNSATYRQSSRPTDSGTQIDPENHLLGHFPLSRLDAEGIRDSMLAVSGELDLSIGGPYVPTNRAADGEVIVEDKTKGAHRRSIYLQQRRTQVAGLLEVFDGPSVVINCTFRASTTVPLQSLTLLNSSFVRGRAKALATRVATEAGPDYDERIRRAFLLACARKPTATELKMAQDFLREQPLRYSGRTNAEASTWIDFCHMLLSSNTFLYVE